MPLTAAVMPKSLRPSGATCTAATAIMKPLAFDYSNPGQKLPDSPLDDAEAVIRRAEPLAASKTEDQAGKRAADAPAPAPNSGRTDRGSRSDPTRRCGRCFGRD